VRVRSGDRYRSDGPVLALPNGCQIRYILDNYPGSSATTAEEAAARQMAIWHFSDGVDLTTIPDSQAAVRDRAIAIATEAESGPCPLRRTEPPDLQITPAVANASPGQQVTYTVTAGALDAGRTIQVALTGPALFDNGQQQISLALDAAGALTFGVTSSGEGSSTVSIELPYRLEAGTVFSQIDKGRPEQRLVMAERLDLVAKATAQGIWASASVPTAPATTAPAVTETPAPSSPTIESAPPPPTETLPPLPPPTERPPQHKPTAAATTEAQPSPIAAATTEVQPGPTAAAEQQTPQPIVAQSAGGGAVPQRPAKLPNTGGQASPAWLALGIAGLLLSVGWVVRRREVHR